MSRNRSLSALLGDAVRARRVAQGMTQEVLAQRAGVSIPTVSALEGGKDSIRTQNLYPILELLGLDEPLKWILQGEANPYRSRVNTTAQVDQSEQSPSATTTPVTVEDLEEGAWAEKPQARIGRDPLGEYISFPIGLPNDPGEAFAAQNAPVIIEGMDHTSRTELLKVITYSLIVSGHHVTVIDQEKSGEWGWVWPFAQQHGSLTADQIDILAADRLRLTLDTKAPAPVFILAGDDSFAPGSELIKPVQRAIRVSIINHQPLRVIVSGNSHDPQILAWGGRQRISDKAESFSRDFPTPDPTEPGSFYLGTAIPPATRRVTPFKPIPTSTLEARLNFLHNAGKLSYFPHQNPTATTP